MKLRVAAHWLACVAAITAAACDDQFDFDTETDGAVSEPDADADSSAVSDGWLESDVSRPAGRIACGASTCVLPLRACCVRSSGPACIEPAEVVCSGVLIQCDSSNDCRLGTICCATVIDAALDSVRCELPADCAAPGQVELCDPSDPTACTTCAPAAAPLPAGYHACL
jgi:hypothetical protein